MHWIWGLVMAMLVDLTDAQRKNARARVYGRYLQLPLKYELAGYLGTPSKSFSLQLSFHFDEIIVMDMNCGESKTNCEKYCRDDDFMPIYCSPLCLTFTPQMRLALCNRLKHVKAYNSTRSETSRTDGTHWVRRIGGLRTLYGDEWSDRLVFYYQGVFVSDPMLTVERIHFVSALLFDMRALEGGSGVFGLASGPHSPLLQIIEQRKLQNRVASFSDHRSNKFYHNEYHHRIMTVGAVDKGNCAEFRWIPTVTAESWVFAVERINFMGLEWKERTLILLAFGQKHTFIPAELGERILAEKIVEFRTPYFARKCPDSTVPNVSLFTATDEIVLDSKSLVELALGSVDTLCFMYLQMNGTSPYATNGIWMLGDNVLNQYCVALDYERHMIGLAPRRRRVMVDR